MQVAPPIPFPTPAEWQAMREMASILAKTEFVPRPFSQRPDAVLAAIMKGRSLRIDPMTSLSEINIINGRPSMSANLMMTLIRRDGHSIEVTESSDTSVTVTGRRADSGDTYAETWDVTRAEQAGLLNKDNWKQYRKNMLQARSISGVARFLFADALAGIGYVPEELESIPAEQELREEPRNITQYQISDTQRAQAAQLGNSLDIKWPPGRYAAELGAMGGNFEALIAKLTELHIQQHGIDDPHVKAAAAGTEEPA